MQKQLLVKLDAEIFNKFKAYCALNNITMAEAIKRHIQTLELQK